MLEFGENVVGIVSLEITEQDVENIIVSSFEGGSNYWMGIDNTTKEWKDKPKDEPVSIWATKIILKRKSVKLFDIEESEDDSNWILTLEKLLKGIKLNIKNRPFASDKENWDATDADCIIQFALFDEIVYG